MVETTPLPTTDVTVFRPDLPPLDAATVLIGATIDHHKLIRTAMDELETSLLPSQHHLLAVAKIALDTATEKQQSAIEKIQEFQRIPGNN